MVVVTTTNAAGLERCLASLGPEEPEFEIVVVLNGADDDVRECAAGADATVVESVVNRGLAGGANLGRAAATGEFVVLLHDDAEAQPGWLSALVRCADEHPEAGAVGSRVLNPDGTLQLAGAVLWRDATTSSVTDGEFNERRAVDYAGSAALLVRAASWDAVGGMDDALYPAYYVDVDLATAIRARGEAVLYEPAARAMHHRGTSSSARVRTFATARNRLRFRTKWSALLAGQAERGDRADAFARSAAEWERIRAAGPPPREPAPVPVPAEDRHFLRMDRVFKDALLAQLTGEVEELHATIGRKDADLRAMQAEISRLAASSRTG